MMLHAAVSFNIGLVPAAPAYRHGSGSSKLTMDCLRQFREHVIEMPLRFDVAGLGGQDKANTAPISFFFSQVRSQAGGLKINALTAQLAQLTG